MPGCCVIKEVSMPAGGSLAEASNILSAIGLACGRVGWWGWVRTEVTYIENPQEVFVAGILTGLTDILSLRSYVLEEQVEEIQVILRICSSARLKQI